MLTTVLIHVFQKANPFVFMLINRDEESRYANTTVHHMPTRLCVSERGRSKPIDFNTGGLPRGMMKLCGHMVRFPSYGH